MCVIRLAGGPAGLWGLPANYSWVINVWVVAHWLHAQYHLSDRLPCFRFITLSLGFVSVVTIALDILHPHTQVPSFYV